MRIQHLRNQGVPEEDLKRLEHDKDFTPEMGRRIPEEVGLIGLVPAGVGIAYLLFYFAAGRRVGAPITERPRSVSPAPPEPPHS